MSTSTLPFFHKTDAHLTKISWDVTGNDMCHFCVVTLRRQGECTLLLLPSALPPAWQVTASLTELPSGLDHLNAYVLLNKRTNFCLVSTFVLWVSFNLTHTPTVPVCLQKCPVRASDADLKFLYIQKTG